MPFLLMYLQICHGDAGIFHNLQHSFHAGSVGIPQGFRIDGNRQRNGGFKHTLFHQLLDIVIRIVIIMTLFLIMIVIITNTM